MGEIILSGGGNADQTAEAHHKFVNCMDSRKTVLYIPLAGDPSYRSFENSLDYVHHSLSPFGVKEIKMWTDLKNKTVDDMKPFSGVYISGGSFLTLNSVLSISGFDKVLEDYINLGGKIFGQSAGAIVLGKQFVQSGGHDTTEEIKSSMNLLPPYNVWCHYDSTDDERLKKYSLLHHSPILAIPDGGAVHCSEGVMNDLDGTAFEFKDGKKERMSDR